MESRINSPFPWLEALISYFRSLKEIDDEIESIRVSLCGKPQFSPKSLFSHLDSNNKSFITLNDFTSFLQSQNSIFEEFKLRKMIHNFDKDNDFSLNLKEFLGLIIPRKNLDLKKNVYSMINSSSNNNGVTPEITANLKNLILKEMNLVKELDQISGKIKNSRLFSTYEAFLAIVGNDRYMTKSNLFNFLKNNNVMIDEGDVAQIMFRLDTDNDDKIFYGEFKEIFYQLGDDIDYIPKKEVITNNNKYKDESYSFANKENYNYNNNKKLYDKYINYNNDIDNYNDNDQDNNNDNKYPNKKVKGYNDDNNYVNKKFKGYNDDNNYVNKKFKDYNDDNNYVNKKFKDYNDENNYVNKKFKDYNDDNNNINKNVKDYNDENNYVNKKVKDYNDDNNYANKNAKDYNDDNNYANKNAKNYNDDNNEYKRNYDSDEDEEKSNEKKSKKTKKKVLRPANNDNDSNVLHSKEPNKNYIKKNPQEISSSKHPDINNNNSNDNYTFNLISKYSCNNNHKGLDSDDNSDDNESEYKFDSKKTKRMKLKRKISHTKEELEDKTPNESIDESNYEKSKNKYREYNKRFLSSNDDNNNDNNDEYNTLKYNNEKCKGCQISSNNMYDNLRERNNNSNNTTRNQTKIEDKKNMCDYDENSNTLFMDRNKNNTYANNDEYKYESTLNEPRTGIYKRKEELLRKYLGSYNYNDHYGNDNNNDYNMNEDRKRNDKSNYYFDSKENISTRINKEYSSQKMDKYNKYNNNEDNDDYGNDKKGFKKKTENRYIASDSNSNSPKRNDDDQDNGNHRPTFAERFKRIKENKNNYFESSSTPLRSNPIQKQVFNRVPLNGDNLEQKKDLFFKLLVDYIEGGSNEEIKGMITKAANNIYFDLFEDIKKENKPGIQRDDIDKFMNENGYNVKDDEIDVIMEKMDKNKDGVIDYEEFIGEVQFKNY